MGLFNLCSGDDLVQTLHDVFNANILRVPEARIKPLSALAVIDKKSSYWGYLPDLVEGTLSGNLTPQSSQMADISGKQSRSVNLDLGMQIMGGFLSGFDVPSAGIAAKFSGAKTVSFSFGGVVRSFISPAELGNVLSGHVLNKDNAANDQFFNQTATLLVIDSVITSPDFSMQVGEKQSANFSLDVPAIEDIVSNANAGVQVETSGNLDITFKGNTALTFAFTCLRCSVDSTGRLSLTPDSDDVSFAVVRKNQGAKTASPSYPHLRLYDDPGLIEWE